VGPGTGTHCQNKRGKREVPVINKERLMARLGGLGFGRMKTKTAREKSGGRGIEEPWKNRKKIAEKLGAHHPAGEKRRPGHEMGGMG